MAAARISGVNIPEAKRVEIALTYIYGIGLTTSRKVLTETGINPDTRVKDLTEAEVTKLRDYITKNHRVEGDLQREVGQNIKRLKEINSYRGLRHKASLPVHGQRTKTNARTKRGRKVTMGSGRKKAAAKT
jgi:small subunit ribosomal protein S13